jgi:Ca2+-binding EF-hand superfamily protein
VKKTLLIAGIAALSTAPLIAQGMRGHEGHGMMAPEPMTRTDVEARAKARFAEMDANKDGAVTQAEIASTRTEHMSKMQGEMFTKMDADKNGSISRAEFDAHHQNMMSGGMAPPPMAGHGGMKRKHMGHGEGGKGRMGRMEDRMFGMADANKDGIVTEAEATQAALTRFDKVDTDRDGSINDAERKAAREMMRAEWKAKKAN